MGALLVYDITKRDTFDNLHIWIDLILNQASQDLQVILIGNKLDLVSQNQNLREVETSEA